ncbi:hypothetical protein Busp01_54650 [Trinickia caryophylli]|uniref:Invasion protein B family protein n=1 Tax=Trinickia caryophylli TaxID=28094 RepID=A0A1X7H4I5_TRICW|nr:hypothetical protein Busp01_54650 [Trinickia caryophylli]SMF79646.1 Invasion protein B family protein [Trinickia caryophylli]
MTVRGALMQLGVPDRILDDFDSHSTISIETEGGAVINISVSDDRLFIWSPIKISEERLIDGSAVVLPIITTPMRDIETGHLTLGRCNDGFELKGLVNVEALAGDRLHEVINDFYGALRVIAGCA